MWNNFGKWCIYSSALIKKGGKTSHTRNHRWFKGEKQYFSGRFNASLSGPGAQKGRKTWRNIQVKRLNGVRSFWERLSSCGVALRVFWTMHQKKRPQRLKFNFCRSLLVNWKCSMSVSLGVLQGCENIPHQMWSFLTHSSMGPWEYYFTRWKVFLWLEQHFKEGMQHWKSRKGKGTGMLFTCVQLLPTERDRCFFYSKMSCRISFVDCNFILPS